MDDFGDDVIKKEKKHTLSMYAFVFFSSCIIISIAYFAIYLNYGIEVTRVLAGLSFVFLFVGLLRITVMSAGKSYFVSYEAAHFLISLGILLWPIIKYIIGSI